jgi:hypothetical protein
MIRAVNIDLDPSQVGCRITKDNYPFVFEVLEAVSHDSGSGAGRSSYGVPPRWVDGLPLMNIALEALSTEERETFAIGEVTESEAIALRSPWLGDAHAMLNDFFDGWQTCAP